MKKIGMRNIKTAIAVFICIITLGFSKFNFPFYACIAAIITMDKTIYNSFKIGKNRTIGTTIGALVGLVFALLMPNNNFLIPLCMAIGISLTIYLCNTLGYKKSITIACIVFIAITGNLKGTSPLHYATNRLFETVLGIIIAVIVNYLVFPPNLKKQIFESSNKIHKDLLLLCGENFYNENVKNLEELYNHIKTLESSIAAYEDEYKISTDNLNLNKYKNSITLFYKLHTHLMIVEEMKNSVPLKDTLYKELHNLTSLQFKEILEIKNNDLVFVFNYHMEKVKDILNNLNNISML